MIVQGDVYFTKTPTVPKGAKQVKRGARGYIVAEGEATGHAHVIKEDVMLYEQDGTLYVRAFGDVHVRHEEHLPVTLKAGVWKVGTVREYDPFLEETRIVRD